MKRKEKTCGIVSVICIIYDEKISLTYDNQYLILYYLLTTQDVKSKLMKSDGE